MDNRNADLTRRVGKRLKSLRLERGFSQSYLELLSGIPKARISRYENGHVTPSLQSLDVLAAHLGKTLGEFLTGV